MRLSCVVTSAVLLGSAFASAQQTETPTRVHVETSFDVVVHAPASEAMKLFTPEGERAWSGEHWDPHYVYPAGLTHDSVGAVFTIQHGPLQTIWTVVRRDDVEVWQI